MMLWLVIGLGLAAPANDAASWDSFLGAGRREQVPATLPIRWSEHDGIAWRCSLVGHGQSSPVVWGDTIFVTSVSGPMKDTFHLSAIDARNGALRWQRSFDNPAKVKSSFYVSRAAPTPVVDGERVIAFFEGGDVVALTHDGVPLWTRRLTDDFGAFENRFGLAASLCQHRDLAFVLVDHDGPSYLVALNKKDGEVVWRAERASRSSWSSPVAVELEGRAGVLVSSTGAVDAYDAADGTLLWRFEDIGGNSSNTPLMYEGGWVLIGAAPDREDGPSSPAARSNMLLRLTGDNRLLSMPEVLWRANRVTSSFATPILHDGLAYYVNGTGVLNCVDASTGERVYTQRLDHPVWATPLAVDDRVYFFGRDGVTKVVRAGRDFEVLVENRLWPEDAVDPSATQGEPEESSDDGGEPRDARERQPILYGYAVVDGDLILRAGAMLYRVGPVDV